MQPLEVGIVLDPVVVSEKGVDVSGIQLGLQPVEIEQQRIKLVLPACSSQMVGQAMPEVGLVGSRSDQRLTS